MKFSKLKFKLINIGSNSNGNFSSPNHHQPPINPNITNINRNIYGKFKFLLLFKIEN